MSRKPKYGFNSGDKEILKYKKIYSTWHDMLRRCLDEQWKNNHDGYNKSYVCDEWIDYNNFYNWWIDNYYELGEEQMCLDKDILIHNNQLYSKDTCLIVPQHINKLFVKRKRCRGELPIGVSKNNKKGNTKFLYRVRLDSVLICYTDDKNEGFLKYKEEKEKYIKKVADDYLKKYDSFPKKLYDAMYSYEVMIDD